MIQVGKIQSMTIEHITGGEVLLKLGGETLVPLHPDDVNKELKVGEKIDVFVYFNKADALTATTQTPKLLVDHFAMLEVVSDSRSGSFVDIGLGKDLYVPKTEQYGDLGKGDHAIIYMYFDVISQRLVGSSRYDEYTEVDDIDLSVGQEVDLLVVRKTDLGYVAIVDQAYEGLIYHNDIFQTVKIGETLRGFVRKVRDDGKIDVTMRAFGYRKVEGEVERIMNMIEEHDGILYYTDKSDPEVIRDVFNMSKKVFKKTIGALYREKMIVIESDCIRKA